MRRPSLCALLAVGRLSLAAAEATANCTVTDATNQDTYDLWPLSSPADYSIDDGHNRTIHLNICRGVVTEVWKVDDAANVGIYVEGDQGGLSLGSRHDAPTVLPSPRGEPDVHSLSLHYPAGSECPAGGRYSSLLVLECDRAIFGSGHPILAGTSDGGCAHFFVWKTPHACPRPPSRGFGSALLVFLFVVIIVAVAFYGSSVAYNRFVLKRHGADQFPAIPRPTGLFQSVKDAVRSLRGLVSGRDRNGFRGLPTGPDEAANLFGEEDDDDE